MTRETFLIILAILVIISPFSGLPNSWLAIILTILGALVLIVSISLRRQHKNLGAAGE